jgi:hypothetical protein
MNEGDEIHVVKDTDDVVCGGEDRVSYNCIPIDSPIGIDRLPPSGTVAHHRNMEEEDHAAYLSLCDSIYFQYPHSSSGGKYVVTAVNKIESNGTNPELLGVLISNYFVATFQNSFNFLSILDSGYVFLIDKLNVSNIIIHPKTSKQCTQVECAEDLSPSEYRVFKDTVLSPIQDGERCDIIYEAG